MKKQFLLGLMAMLLPLAAWADGLTIKFADDVVKDGKATFEYAGTATETNVKNAVKVFAGDTELTEGQFVLYVTYASGSKQAKVGEATVEAYGQGEYTKLNNSETCTITPKVVTTKFAFANVGNDGVSKVYGESDQVVLKQLVTPDEVQASLAEGDPATEFADFLNCLEVARREGTSNSEYVNEEGYTVLVQGKSGEFESNYKYVKPVTASYTTLHIKKRPLTVTLLDKENGNAYTEREYNAGELNVSALITNRYKFDEADEEAATGLLEADEEYIKVASIKVINPENAKIVNAGEYILQAVLNEVSDGTHDGIQNNYEVNPITFTISPAQVTIKAKANATGLSSEYTGIAGEFVVANDNFDFEGLLQTTDALNLIVKADITGDASVKEDGYGFKLYQGEDEDTAEEVAQVEGVYTSGNYTYTFDEDLAYMINPKSLGSLADSYNGTKITGAVNNGVVFTYTGKDYADAENVSDVEGKIIVKYANGSANGATLTPGTDYTIDVVGYNTPTNATSGVAINANEKFTIAVKGKGNYTGQYNITENTIAKAELKITLKEDVDADMTFKKIADSKTTGNLAQYFDFEGLVNADKEQGEDEELLDYPKASVLTMEAKHSNASTAPGWMIQIWYGNTNSPKATEENPVELKNYTVTLYETKYYTILPEIDFVLNRDAVDDAEAETLSVATLLETYNGTSPVVKIKQDQTIKEDTWTGLVLPFKTTPYEISKAFGYAVVDVPSYNNSNPEEGVFKLNVKDEIGANTLVLIKTYKDRKLAEEPLEFDLKANNRVIEYDPEFAFEDAVGIKYHAVYTLGVDIMGWEDTYYLSGGNFYYAGDRKTATVIKPLSGYVTVPGAGANARIIVEEADGSTTAINAITGEAISNSAEGWYSIDGMKLNAQPTQKGVYINNGKKVVIK